MFVEIGPVFFEYKIYKHKYILKLSRKKNFYHVIPKSTCLVLSGEYVLCVRSRKEYNWTRVNRYGNMIHVNGYDNIIYLHDIVYA